MKREEGRESRERERNQNMEGITHLYVGIFFHFTFVHGVHGRCVYFSPKIKKIGHFFAIS